MKKTALYEIHKGLGAKFMAFGGYQMPLQYLGVSSEHSIVRLRAGLFDVSHMGKFFIWGKEASAFLNYLLTNNVAKLKTGKAQYTLLTNPRGGTIDDLIVYRLGENEFLTIVNAANTEKDWKWMQKHLAFFPDAEMENVTENYTLLALSGPFAPDILRRHTPVDVDNMRYYSITGTKIEGLDVFLATTGYTGERTFEIMVKNESAEALWNLIMDLGSSHMLQPAGLGARDVLRMEMGYPLYGNELSDYISPLEAGLKFAVRLKKGQFIGSSLLQAEYTQGVSKKLVGIITVDRGIPRTGMWIYDESGEKIVGEVTSGSYGFSVRDGIGLAYINTEFVSPDNIFVLKIRNKKVRIKIVDLPFVKNTSLLTWLRRKK